MDISSTTSRFMPSQSTNLISSSTVSTSNNISRKRKGTSSAGCQKTHSQIEKRRRDKMNGFINELSSLVPACNNRSRKLDKLSVLRMAVQHMKASRGASFSCDRESNRTAAFLPDEEFKHLMLRSLQTPDGFLFVADCNRGKLLFVSESVYKILNYSQNDLIGHSLFDYLHHKDITKVKEQLYSADTVPPERLSNAKSGPLGKTDFNRGALRLCPGARRSFFCRMKCNRKMDDEDFSPRCSKKNDRKDFCTIHSTGYLKSLSPAAADMDKNNGSDDDRCNLICLVAVGRLHPHAVSQTEQRHFEVKPMEFVSRHAIDGKFVFVDQRATSILSYLPQELLGTSFYEYIHKDDIAHLAACHRQVLQVREKINTNCYKFKIKDGSFITLKSCWFSFENPWTKEVENIISTNTVVMTDTAVISDRQGAFEEDAQSVVHTDMKTVAAGVKNITREKKTAKPARDYSTKKEAATSEQAKDKRSFEEPEAAGDSGPRSSGDCVSV